MIYRWGFAVPILALSSIICGALIIIFCLLGAPEFASRTFARAWARINAAASLMKVNIKGAEKVDKSKSYVIVANHQSLVDIYVLYGYLGMEVKWMMKQELRQVPILGLTAVLMGHILIDRTSRGTALASMQEAREKIRDGMSVIFFAEGTRSRTGDLKKFKKGAFRLSAELGIPILPVAIKGTAKVLPSDTLDLMPGSVTMEFCDPILNGQGHNTAVLSQLTWDSIQQALTQDAIS